MSKKGRTIFISYSHKDKRWLDRLTVFLKPYHQRGLKIWDDRQITPSDEWEPAIYSAIDSAAAAILLVSADFLASDFIAGQELRLLRKAESRHTKVLPLFVGKTAISAYPDLARLEGLNAPDRPLNMLSRPKADATLAEVADKIASLLGPEPTPPKNVEMLRRYEAVATGLAVLETLQTSSNDDYTLTALKARIGIASRKLAYAVVEELAMAGWIEKYQGPNGVSYRIADEGAQHLKHFSNLAGRERARK